MTLGEMQEIVRIQMNLTSLEEGLNAFPPNLDARDLAEIEALQVRANKLEHRLAELIEKGVGP